MDTFGPQDNDDSTCHRFAEESAGTATDNKNRVLFQVPLHMDTTTVTDVVAYVHLTTPHAVGDCITGTSVYDDLSLVHGVTWCVVSISMNNNRGTAHKHGKVPTGHTINRDGHIIATQSICNKPLAKDMVDDDLFYTISYSSPDLLVEGGVMKIFGINKDCFHANPPTVFTSS